MGTGQASATRICAAGSIVSVEARHAAGGGAGAIAATCHGNLIAITELVPELNPFKGRAYDRFVHAQTNCGDVGSLNILK